MDDNQFFPEMNEGREEPSKPEEQNNSGASPETNEGSQGAYSSLQGSYARFYQGGAQTPPPQRNQGGGAYYGGSVPPTYGSTPNYGSAPNYNYNTYQYTPYSPVPPEPVKKKSNAWKVWVAILCVICLCGSIIAGAVLSSRILKDKIGSGDFHFPEIADNGDQDGTLSSLQNSSYESVADIAEDVGKSVVTIITAISTMDGFITTEGEVLGSGIVIGEQGDKLFIATNYHVIEDASAVSVIVGSDETKAISAYHQGSDEDSDLAVIYIRKSDVPEEILGGIKIATLGNSNKLRLGDLAIAIGSPVDKSFGNTVTVGTISGLERSVTFTDDENVASTMILLQTDAAINPGNSGGALVNGRGEVIGINNAKIVDTDVEGMGFAIPSDTAKPILETLINEGKIVRPYMGILGNNASDIKELESYNLLSGVFVQRVVSGSPASQAGIKAYDVIVSFNGVTVDNFDDLTVELKKCSIGQKVEIEVIRDYLEGEPRRVTLELVIQDKNA